MTENKILKNGGTLPEESEIEVHHQKNALSYNVEDTPNRLTIPRSHTINES
jgi:hypothetical protein